MLKKYIFNIPIVLIGLVFNLLLIPYCSASIPDSEVALGGIGYKATIPYVESVYGFPDRIISNESSPLFTGYLDTYYYGDTFSILFQNSSVLRLQTTANNGIHTPSGIAVGSDNSLIEDAYGTADNTQTAIFGKIVSKYYHIKDNENIGLKFNFDGKGKVISIYAGQFD